MCVSVGTPECGWSQEVSLEEAWGCVHSKWERVGVEEFWLVVEECV